MANSLKARLLLLATGILRGAAAQCAEDEPCIHMQVAHSTNTKVFSKRAVEVQLANRTDIAYYAQLNIGTPAQAVFAQLDTGSFELWVNPTCSGLSFSDAAFCNSVGVYDTSKSTTAKSLGTTKTLNYGIGSANITYVKDSISLPGAKTAMSAVQFGVATSSVDEFSGILGIGYGLGLTTKYRNFVDELAFQNQTSVKAFSVGLGSKVEQEGSIIFGGVDTSKFAGKLVTQPILAAANSPDGVPRYWIAMNNMSLTPPSGRTKTWASSTMDVFLDTGATLTLLPQALADAIAKDFGATGADSSGYYQVDCGLADLDGTVNFGFPGVEIRVPYNEFIRESVTGAQDAGCVLGISGSSSFTLLGDTFMRSAYAVFDLENNQIHMQQYANCGSTAAAVKDASSFSGLQGKCSTSTGSGSGSGTSPSRGNGGSQISSTIPATRTAATATATATGTGAKTGTSPAATTSGPSGSSSSGSGTEATSAGISVVGKQCSPLALVVAMMVSLLLI